MQKKDYIIDVGQGWFRVRDPNLGLYYYANPDENVSQWSEPDVLKSQSALPLGWKQEVDPATGTLYFVSLATMKSQWEFPTVDQPVVPDDDQLKEAGWLRLWDEASCQFYFRHMHNSKSQWHVPDLSLSTVSQTDKLTSTTKSTSYLRKLFKEIPTIEDDISVNSVSSSQTCEPHEPVWYPHHVRKATALRLAAEKCTVHIEPGA